MSGGCASRYAKISSTSSGRSATVRVGERVLDAEPVRLLGRERREAGDELERPLRDRVRVVPPGVVQASTSRSTRSGAVEHELLRDHPAEARADDVRALDPGGVEDAERVAGHLRGRVRAGR